MYFEKQVNLMENDFAEKKALCFITSYTVSSLKLTRPIKCLTGMFHM